MESQRQRTYVRVLKILDAGHFFLKEEPGPGMSEEAKAFERLTEELKDYAENDQMPAVHVNDQVRGKICLGKLKTAGQWYRVRINSIMQRATGHHASCYFLDYALDNQMIPVRSLCEIPAHLNYAPYQAKECVLHGLQPATMGYAMDLEAGDTDFRAILKASDKFDPHAKKHVKSLIKAEDTDTESVTIDTLGNDSEGRYQVRLYFRNEKLGLVCLNDYLIEKQYAIPATVSPIPKQSDSELSRPIKTRSKRRHASVEKFLNPSRHLYPPEKPGGSAGSSPSVGLSPLTSDAEQFEDIPRLELNEETAEEHNQLPDPNTNLSPNARSTDLIDLASSIAGINSPVSGSEASSISDRCVNSDNDTLKFFIGRGRGLGSPISPGASPRPAGGRGQAMQIALSSMSLNSLPQSKESSPESTIVKKPGLQNSGVNIQNWKSTTGLNYGDTNTSLEGVVTSPVISLSGVRVGRGRISEAVMSDKERSPGHKTHANASPSSAGSPGDFSPGKNTSNTTLALGRGKLQAVLRERVREVPPCSMNESKEPPSKPNTLDQSEFVVIPSESQNMSTESRLPAVASASASNLVSKVNQGVSLTSSSPAIRSRSSKSPSPILKRSSSITDTCSGIPSSKHIEEDSFSDTACVYSSPLLNNFCGAAPGFSLTNEAMNLYQVTPDDIGVRVYGQKNPTRTNNVKDALFSPNVSRALEKMGITGATYLQLYMWASVIRGRSTVGVAAASLPRRGERKSAGRTLAWLPPVITELAQTDVYERLPPSGGPYVLVLVPSVNTAFRIHKQIMAFLSEEHYRTKLRSMFIFAGGAEDSQEIDLLNGCGFLVATPSSLIRMLEKQVTNLDRLAHLVLEYAEQLLEKFPDQMDSIMKRFHKATELREGDELTAPQQILVLASQWTEPVLTFTNMHLISPTVILASKIEAAFAGQVKQLVTLCRADQRFDELHSQINGLKNSGHKVIIFVNNEHTATNIYKILQSWSVVALLVHEGFSDAEFDDILKQWKLPHRKDSKPVLVATDCNLDGMHSIGVDDCSCVIHFDAPTEKHTLESRIWCMRKWWKSPIREKNDIAAEVSDPSKEDDTMQCTSQIYMTENDDRLALRVIRILERSGSEVPPQLHIMADQYQEKREKGKRNQLCVNLKAFGACRDERRCLRRHRLFYSLDYPGQNACLFKIPLEGQVKIKVTYVTSASQFYARLLEVTSPTGVTTPLSTNYSTLIMDLNFHYANNKTYCDDPEAGKLYAWEDMQHNFNRVEIIQLSGTFRRGIPEEVTVFFVDTGEERKAHSEELLELPEKFAAVPYWAVEVFVCRVQPKYQDTEWPINTARKMSEHILHKELVGNIALSLGNTLWLESLIHRSKLKELNLITNDFSVRQLLLEDPTVEENPEHLYLLYEACRGRGLDIPYTEAPGKCPNRAFTVHGLLSYPKTQELPLDGFVEVVMTAIESPNLIYVQLAPDYNQMLDFDYELREYVRLNQLETPKKLKVATLVLATFPGEKTWNRGKVTEVLPDDEYDIFFVDLGDSEVRKITDILPLPSRFQTKPFYAIECCLVGLEPIEEGEWDEEIGGELYDRTRKGSSGGDGKVLMARVISTAPARHTGKHLFGIELIDTSMEYDVNIGLELVREKKAKLASTRYQELFPQLSDLKPDTATAHIMQSCIQILQSQDDNKMTEAARCVQKEVMRNLNEKNDLVREGVVCSLCQVLQMTREPAVLELLYPSLVYLIKDDDEMSKELQKNGAIGIMCHNLDISDDATVRMSTLWAMQQLMQNYRCRLMVLNTGGPRILAKLLSEDDVATNVICADILCQLLTDLNSSELNDLVTPSGCLEVISEKISSDNESVVCHCLSIIENLASNTQMRDKIRKAGALKSICPRLDFWFNKEVREKAVRTLRRLANDNRFNKDVMNEHKITTVLHKYLKDTNFSPEATKITSELCARLEELTQRNRMRSPSKATPPKHNSIQNGDNKVITNGHQNGINISMEVSGIRPLSNKETIENKPLTAKFCSNSVPVRSAKPDVRWCQDRWSVGLQVDVKLNIKESIPSNIATFEENAVSFSAVADSTLYNFDFDLYELIEPSECQIQVTAGNVLLGLRKKSRGQWARLLKNKMQKPVFLYVDFEHFEYSSDEDDDDPSKDKPTESPLAIFTRNTLSEPSFSKVTPYQPARRQIAGLPAELIESSQSDDDSSSDEFREKDKNNKYGDFYF